MRVESVHALFEALNRADVRYLVVGGLAVVAHNYVRYTADVDLVLALDPENVKRAMATLELLGYVPRVPVPATDFADPVKRESWIREKGMVVFQMFSTLHDRTPIDLFVSEPFDFQQEWQRAVWLPVLGSTRVPVVSIEQLLAMKETTGRDKDQRDVEFLSKIVEGKSCE